MHEGVPSRELLLIDGLYRRHHRTDGLLHAETLAVDGAPIIIEKMGVALIFIIVPSHRGVLPKIAYFMDVVQ